MNWRYLLIHHSASPDHEGLDFDNIRNYHLNVNNWRDIGYHFLIEQAEGMPIVVQGRPLTESGAHCPGWNSKAIGVCLMGNYEVDTVPDALLNTLVERVLYPQCAIWDIPSDNIHGHRDHRATACPGKNLYDMIPQIKIMVATLLAQNEVRGR